MMEGRRQANEVAEDRLISGAWYTEAFARMRRLPSLDKVLSGGKSDEPQTPDDMLAVMHTIQAVGGDVSIELVDEKDL